jgi:hypothetical protein
MSLIGTKATWALLQTALLSAAPRQSARRRYHRGLGRQVIDDADSRTLIRGRGGSHFAGPGTDGDTPDRSVARFRLGAVNLSL